ncbi:MAG: hypothetical protein K2G83_02730 [Ruminococcus sp.]|nr:hypothetical protein [Ruminococcus sp.]
MNENENTEQVQSQYRKELNDIIVEYLGIVKPLAENYHKFDSAPQLRDEFLPDIQNKLKNQNEISLEKLRTATNEYFERLEKAYIISGSKADTEDLILLNPSVFKMTQQEFNEIVEKHIGNHTMEIALRSYAEVTGLHVLRRIYTKEEKEKLSESVYRNACSYIENTSPYFEIDSFIQTMAGTLFNEANVLTE